tara:strand:+ start:273 stop:2585 length:2313 start_codon:yes stop_codon:yes gene_type:complete
MAISNYGIGGFDNADSSFQGLGNLVSTFVLNVIPGCMDPTMFNYNPNATVDDGSCISAISGCTDPAAINYNSSVNTDDGSCIYSGCTDSAAINYNPLATVDDGSCITATYGCTVTTTALIGDGSGFSYPIYWNSSSSYNSPCDDTNGPGCFGAQTGTNCCCEPVIVGCTDYLATNYDSSANYQAQPGSNMECIVTILGCTNPTANNYNSSANVDDGSCTYTVIYGCTDPTADNYDSTATQDDSTCEYLGCIDPTACNFDSMANVDDGTCYYPDGCTDPAYVEYDASYLCDDGSCLTLVVLGCTDALAANYDPLANVDDGSCSPCPPGIIGCMDPLAINYDPCAVVNNSASCTYGGCIDPTATNYDASATVDDGSCVYTPVVPSCTDTNGVTYTIGDDHPTLNATLFEFSYNEPGLMAIGDCGRMYVTKSTLSGGAGHSWGCDGISVASTGTTSSVLYGAEVQVAGRGSQNTQDMVSAGCGGAGTIIEYLGTDWPGFHLPSMQELVHVWQNVGPGNIYGLGNLTAITYGNSGDAGVWISEEADPPANLSYAKDIEWAGPGGGNITIAQKDQGAGYFGYTLGVLYEGNFGCTDSTATNYDSTASWDDGSCTFALSLGDQAEGGTVVYLDGFGGGIVASNMTAPDLKWSTLSNNIATGGLIGDGQSNTDNILASDGSNAEAASYCDNLSIVVNGVTYDDWYLPSGLEVESLGVYGGGQLYTTINGGVALTTSDALWTSNNYTTNLGWIVNVVAGSAGGSNKSSNRKVIPFRSF